MPQYKVSELLSTIKKKKKIFSTSNILLAVQVHTVTFGLLKPMLSAAPTQWSTESRSEASELPVGMGYPDRALCCLSNLIPLWDYFTRTAQAGFPELSLHDFQPQPLPLLSVLLHNEVSMTGVLPVG